VTYEIIRSEDEWKRQLGPDRYHILRQAGTEAPWSGSLLDVTADGTFTCGGCGQVLFTSEQKFDSHCGWPSFDACEPGTIIERPDHSLGRARTEILCSRCGGHLGHVFDDGPTVTGLRYCVNSLSIDFDPEATP
jgi:methionine-R-sulfoxide reductase